MMQNINQEKKTCYNLWLISALNGIKAILLLFYVQ
jgi:hypothetical protein